MVVCADAGRKLDNLVALDIDVPLEVGAHLPLHLVDLLEAKHLLCNYAPRMVRVCVIADDLRRDHESREEQSVATRTPGVRESHL
jgi:hypothetical protein